jgi:hypothetical protein
MGGRNGVLLTVKAMLAQKFAKAKQGNAFFGDERGALRKLASQNPPFPREFAPKFGLFTWNTTVYKESRTSRLPTTRQAANAYPDLPRPYPGLQRPARGTTLIGKKKI